jgi:hypothetical protein
LFQIPSPPSPHFSFPVLRGDSLWFPFSPRCASVCGLAGEQTGRPADGAGGGASGGGSSGAGTRWLADSGGAPVAVRVRGSRWTGAALHAVLGARRQADQGRCSTPCGARRQAHRGAAAGGCRPPELRIRRGVERILPAVAQTALAPMER